MDLPGHSGSGGRLRQALKSVGVDEHLPLPVYEVGVGGFRGFEGLHVAHPGPCHLQQHGMQRLDGPHLRSGCSKRIGQRASDLTRLNVGLRHLDAAESHTDSLLLGCRIALAVNEVCLLMLPPKECHQRGGRHRRSLCVGLIDRALTATQRA
eukprot:scaffold123219_cov57-Phaeocystis_antarctica.AAC.3